MFEPGSLSTVVIESPTVPLLSPPRAIVSILMLVFGGFLLKGAFTYWHTSRLIRNTPTETVQSMAAGRTELKGTARSGEDPLDQPFGEGEAVVAKWEIGTWFEDDEPGESGEWTTTARGTLATPFSLEDETGRVPVHATDDAEIHVSDENTSSFVVGDDEVEPRSVREFLVEHRDEDLDLDDEDDGWDGKHRFKQEVIPPGEDVYVFGNAVVREDGAGGDDEQRLRVEADDATARFVISDMDEDALATGLLHRSPLVLVLGFVLVVVGFGLALVELGIAG